MILVEYGMKMVGGVFEKVLCRIVMVSEARFGFMPRNRAINAVFILSSLEEECCAKGKRLYMCFVG